MARKRASMREGPLAELFRATEAAQRAQGEEQAGAQPTAPEPTSAADRVEAQLPLEPAEPVAPRAEPVELDATVEHVYEFELGRSERAEAPVARASEQSPVPEPRAPEPVTEVAPNVVELVPERPEPASTARATRRAQLARRRSSRTRRRRAS